MEYLVPATRGMAALVFVVGAWFVQLLMRSTPLTQSRTPSSDTVEKV